MLTIIDLIGMEEKDDVEVPNNLTLKTLSCISENLNAIKHFYERLAGAKSDFVGNTLLALLAAPMDNATHVLLFTAKLNHCKTSDTLVYVFIVK